MQITSIFPRYNDIKHDLIARRIADLYLIQKSASGRTEPSFRKDVGRSTINDRMPKLSSCRKANVNPMGSWVIDFFSLFFFVLPEGRAFFLYPVLLAGRSIGVTLPF